MYKTFECGSVYLNLYKGDKMDVLWKGLITAHVYIHEWPPLNFNWSWCLMTLDRYIHVMVIVPWLQQLVVTKVFCKSGDVKAYFTSNDYIYFHCICHHCHITNFTSGCVVKAKVTLGQRGLELPRKRCHKWGWLWNYDLDKVCS